MNISVVIPNYNGAEIIEKNLSAILSILSKYDKFKTELIVIDDASTDSSVKLIKNIFDSHQNIAVATKILENKRNMGFAPTVNKAVTRAQGEILVLLNTDVVPESSFLDPLLGHFADDSVFAVGCLERSIENDQMHLYGRGLGKWEKGFLVHKAGEITGRKTLWVSCGSGAFRKEIWDKLGGLNEMYAPFYWEDIDISYRALKAGYSVLFESKSVVTHRHSEGAIKKTQKSSYIRAIATRNQFLFVWNNVTEVGLFLTHLRYLPIHILHAVKRVDVIYIRGLIQAVGLLPKVLLYRSKMIKKFVKSDSLVVEEVTI